MTQSSNDLQIALRPMSLTPGGRDLDASRHIYHSTRQEEMAQSGWSQKEIDQFLDFQFMAQHTFYQQEYAEASYELIIAKNKGGEVAGRLYVHRRDDEIRIVDIALFPQYRGQGIGAKLLNDLIEEAERGRLPVRIHVEKNNQAMRLYKRLGFQKKDEAGVYDLMERPPKPQ